MVIDRVDRLDREVVRGEGERCQEDGREGDEDVRQRRALGEGGGEG